MDDEVSVPRDQFDYRSSRALPKELALRRRLETKDYTLKRRDKDVAALQRELALMEEQLAEVSKERSKAEETLERQRSTVQGLQSSVSQLQRDLSKETRRRSTLERQRAEDAAQLRAQETLLGASEARNRGLQQQLEELTQRGVVRDLEASEIATRISRLQEESRAKDREIEELRRQAGLMLTRSRSSEDEHQSLSAALSERNAQLLQLEREAASSRVQIEELTRARDSLVAELQAAAHQHNSERKSQDKAVKDLGRRNKELEEANTNLKRSVFLLEEETKTLKRHLEATSRLVAQERSDHADRLREEYLQSEEHLSLKHALADTRRELAEHRSSLSTKEKLIGDLQGRLESCERSAMLIAQGKHAELVAKEGLAVKCRGYQMRASELEQQSKVLLNEMRALKLSKGKLTAESVRTKTLLQILRKENERLRSGGFQDLSSEALASSAQLLKEDAWIFDTAQLVEEVVRRLYGEGGHKPRSKNTKKKIVTTSIYLLDLLGILY